MNTRPLSSYAPHFPKPLSSRPYLQSVSIEYFDLEARSIVFVTSSEYLPTLSSSEVSQDPIIYLSDSHCVIIASLSRYRIIMAENPVQSETARQVADTFASCVSP